MAKKLLLAGVLGLASLAFAACATPTPEVKEVPVTVVVTKEVIVTQEVPVEVVVTPMGGVPYEALWQGSAHNAVDTTAFRRWDDAAASPDGVPTSCAKCHTSAGYQDFLGVDGSEAGKVDKPVAAKDSQGIQCTACHNPVASNMTSVAFPGKDDEGNAIVIDGLSDAARCMQCHQGRASKASVDAQIEKFKIEDMDAVVAPIVDTTNNVTSTFGFINIHYFAAAATLYGTEVKGGYEYDGKLYDAQFRHVDGYDTCIGCHDPHSLEIKITECAECHEGVATKEDLQNIRMQGSMMDYDGDGDVEEGIAKEIASLQDLLLAQIQKYAMETAGAEIKYDGATYPYFMGADGKSYKSWTARLLQAAYNYQVSVKDPGKFAHGGKYIIELLHDSIEDLGGDVSTLAREDAGHFAGNTMPFRDWDDSATGVPYRCVKCHTDSGLPTFITNGGTMVVDQSGNTLTAGVANVEPSNGFKCVTCHNPAEFPALRTLASVTLPSGKVVSFGGKDADGKWVADDANICIACHQGRESTTSMNVMLRGKEDNTVDKAISFKNIHYYAAGATLFGTEAKGMYEYAGKAYNGQNEHGGGGLSGPTKCTECHDVHKLEVQVTEVCKDCHKEAKTVEDLYTLNADSVDYDGNGKVEGIKQEIDGMRAALLTAIQTYAKDKGAGLVYNPNAYPYFFLDKDGDGKVDKNDKGANINYNGNWTPNLVRAAFNYQAATKDPGQFAHNGKYVVQALYDSIESIGGDVTTMTRPAAPAP